MIKNPKYSDLLRAVSFILILALALPSLVKSVHALEGHEHEVCTSVASKHFHEAEWDCEYQKYNLSSQLLFKSPNIDFIPAVVCNESLITYSESFVDLRLNSQSLRGPPLG
ncbi:MAG: hypothetical protein HKO90_10350 [Flavobacteriaceae bacterium]|nr:hypothetical protein [Flavobacteriaceae bacterium]